MVLLPWNIVFGWKLSDFYLYFRLLCQAFQFSVSILVCFALVVIVISFGFDFFFVNSVATATTCLRLSQNWDDKLEQIKQKKSNS